MVADVVVPCLAALSCKRTTTMKNYKSESRRTTSWTGKEDATPLQSFIDKCNSDNFNRRHPWIADTDEAELVNSFKPEECPLCGCPSIQGFGHTAAGIQRYRCNGCGRTFTPLTNTIFDSRKIPLTEWLDFLLSIFGYGSFRLVSKSNRTAYNTTRYWIDKVFIVLRDYQNDIVLSEKIQLDETFYKVRNPDIQQKDGDLEFRGISRNQICIGMASDQNNVIAFVEGQGRPTIKETLSVLKDHISPGATLIHDMDQSHKTLVKDLNLRSIEYNSKELKKLPDSENPLNEINQHCNMLKKFLNAHSGFIRDDIQDYLNLFCFITNPPEGKHRKVEKLMNMAMGCRKTHRYRPKNSK